MLALNTEYFSTYTARYVFDTLPRAAPIHGMTASAAQKNGKLVVSSASTAAVASLWMRATPGYLS